MVNWQISLAVFSHGELWLLPSPMGIEIATAFPKSDALPEGVLRRCRREAGNADWNPRGVAETRLSSGSFGRVPTYVTVTHRQQLLQRGVLTSQPWISRHRLKKTQPLPLSAFGFSFVLKQVFLARRSLLLSKESCPACTWIWWYHLEYTLPTSHLQLWCNGFGETFLKN